ncbi:MAG TPA: serine hydrolase domain-containing protein [Candidatus Binataceae bacterium]|nr:serine hydrolase domain-containing protein [Candidatus Binataceae bacterium]
MPSKNFFAEDPRAVGLDPAKIDLLLQRAEREVAEGLLPSCQIAIARNGKIAAMKSFGHAVQGGADRPVTDDTLFFVFSCTKAIISAAIWILIGDDKLDVRESAASIVPEFATNGKDAITVEQLLIHTGGFPFAPYAQPEWLDRKRMLERFKEWRLQFPVGQRFVYHGLSAFWVLGEIIRRRSGMDFRDFVRERIAAPLGLPELRLGRPPAEQGRIAEVVCIGEPLAPADYAKMGFPPPPAETIVTEDAIIGFNHPIVRESGAPGGGGIMTAAELAMFYQGLLHNPPVAGGAPIWKPAVLKEALRVRSGDYFDPIFKYKCNRALGVIVAGDDGFANYRGFGRATSPEAFGHGGAGGQLGWGDPVSGISIGYCTNGYDRNEIRQGRRGVAISSLAAVCAA